MSRSGVAAFVLAIGLSLSGCIGDRGSSVDELRLRDGSLQDYTGHELAELAGRVPPEASDPVIEFVSGAEYVNTSGVKLAWVNPTDSTWYLPPGAEKLVVEERGSPSQGARHASLIGTRAETEGKAQARCVKSGTVLTNPKGSTRFPHGFELDDRSMYWPGIRGRLTSGAAEVPEDGRIELPPHRRGFITSLFLAYDYPHATFTLHLTDGTQEMKFAVPLGRERTGRFLGASGWMELQAFPQDYEWSRPPE